MDDSVRLNPGGKLWLAACVSLALGAFTGWFVPSALWDWQPTLAAHEPWRWWTAAFVHWSPTHLLANLAGLIVVAALGRVAAVPAMVTLAWLASWPLVHLSLLLRPELAHYGGLSGLLHGGVAAAALYVARVEVGRRRQIAIAILAGLLTKLLLEAPWGPALQQRDPWDIAVAPLAHVSGALMAALCTVLALARGPSLRAEHVPFPPLLHNAENSSIAHPETP